MRLSVASRSGHRTRVLFRLRCVLRRPRSGLERIINFINVENKNALFAQAERIHAPSAYEIDYALLDETIVEEAKALHSHLVALSIVERHANPIDPGKVPHYTQGQGCVERINTP